MQTINLQKESTDFNSFMPNPFPEQPSFSFSPTLPEITLYYAAIPTDKFSDKGNVIYSEYIFQTEAEAIESGLEYSIATWEDINMFADCGYTYPDVVVCTPQGKFVFHEIYMNEEEREWEIPSKCVYRAHGAPEAFSEKIEEFLTVNYNDGAELINVVCEVREGHEIYAATLYSEPENVFTFNTLGEFQYI